MGLCPGLEGVISWALCPGDYVQDFIQALGLCPGVEGILFEGDLFLGIMSRGLCPRFEGDSCRGFSSPEDYVQECSSLEGDLSWGFLSGGRLYYIQRSSWTCGSVMKCLRCFKVNTELVPSDASRPSSSCLYYWPLLVMTCQSRESFSQVSDRCMDGWIGSSSDRKTNIMHE